MKKRREVQGWTIEKLVQEREQISFPEYQRQPHLWPDPKKSLLIDSILNDIDIPKLYFNKPAEGGYEVVDGQQRLWAIWDFFDGRYEYESPRGNLAFSQLEDEEKKWIRNYKLDVTVLFDEKEDYLRKLFLRLQLGLLLITGEKLNALKGEMKKFIFEEMATHAFVQTVGIPSRRFAKETLCAQVAINIFSLRKVQTFSRTRYEDLEAFFHEYEAPRGKDQELFQAQTQRIQAVLSGLKEAFATKAKDLRNRSLVLSVILLGEELASKGGKVPPKFVSFVSQLIESMRAENRAGFDRKNRELYDLQAFLSSAPGERYQIERRHVKLRGFWEAYQKSGKIAGQ